MTTIAGVLAAGWSDFVDPSRTALVEGTDWRGSLTILDGEGAPVDLSGGVFSCTVWDQVGGALLVTLTATGSADGTLTLSAPASETGGIVPGSALDPVQLPRTCAPCVVPATRAFVQATQPHVVMVWGSVNQDGTTGAAMTTYAQTYYADLKTDAATAKVVVIGHQAAWNAAGNAETPASQAVLDVATTNAAGNIVKVVNQRAAGWFTSAMYAAGSGSTGWYVPSGASGQGHPTPAGTWYLADKIWAELDPVLATIP